MTYSDETVYLNQSDQYVEFEETQAIPVEDSRKQSWKTVTIGGASAILMGAGAMFLASNLDAHGDSSVSSDAKNMMDSGDAPLQVASVDETGLSFADAFSQARAEVGPGGVFRWNGGIYNTYTEKEWQAMTAQEKDEFAQLVAPEIKPSDIHNDYAHTARHHAPASDVTVVDDGTPGGLVDGTTFHDPSGTYYAQNGDAPSADDDVSIVSQGYVQLPDGRIVTYAQLDNSEADVVVVDLDGDSIPETAIVDIDRDGKPDMAIADVDGDGKIADNEVIDMRSGKTMAQINRQQEDFNRASDDTAETADMPLSRLSGDDVDLADSSDLIDTADISSEGLDTADINPDLVAF